MYICLYKYILIFCLINICFQATVLWYRYIKNIHQHGIKFHVLMIFYRFLSTSPRDDSLQKFTTEGLEESVFKNTIWKETLNSYDNQFNQCQQNLSSSITLLNTKPLMNWKISVKSRPSVMYSKIDKRSSIHEILFHVDVCF
jgi:hypothetical protein